MNRDTWWNDDRQEKTKVLSKKLLLASMTTISNNSLLFFNKVKSRLSSKTALFCIREVLGLNLGPGNWLS
jgi:hypothetical protein